MHQSAENKICNIATMCICYNHRDLSSYANPSQTDHADATQRMTLGRNFLLLILFPTMLPHFAVPALSLDRHIHPYHQQQPLLNNFAMLEHCSFPI